MLSETQVPDSALAKIDGSNGGLDSPGYINLGRIPGHPSPRHVGEHVIG